MSVDAGNSSTAAQQDAVGLAEAEAFAALTAMARGRGGPFRPEQVARVALSCSPAHDFDVQRDALEAVLRRIAAARKEELRIVRRPKKGLVGMYRTASATARARPWSTLVLDPAALAGSCECPDFVRNSLGVCKHLLAIAGQLQDRRPSSAANDPLPTRLTWNPVRPLEGMGDWLERVALLEGPPRRGATSLALAAVRRRFSGGQLASTHGDQPEPRLALVRELLRFVESQAALPVPSDPALLTLLRRELDQLSRITAQRADRKALNDALRGLKRKLYPYQREGVERFLANGRLLLADDMGLGKTAQAIASCHALFHAGKVERGLLLVPAALKSQWQREWTHFTDVPVAVVEGGPEERAAAYRKCQRGFLIANYEQLLRDLPVVQRFGPQLVVLDEAQRIKNWQTKTAASVKALTPPLRLVLTGTPLENRVEELASLVDWVDDLALEPKWRLAAAHSERADGTREVVGAKNLGTLRQRLSGCMLRRKRQEVLAQLPARTDTRIPVPLTPEQQGRHDELNQPIAQLMSRARTRPLTQPEFLRLMSLMTTQRVICNGLAQLEFDARWPALATARPGDAVLTSLFSPKLIELRELVSQVVIGQQRKMIVFSQWRRMLKLAHWAVADLLEEAGMRAVFFTGDEGQRRRTRNVVELHDDPSVRILFASDAGGVGLNLQRAASCCVNLELPWNPAVLEQRIGRVYRLGQTQPVQVYNLVAETGIESRIAALVGDKRALFTGLFDGGTDQVRFERSGSFLSKVEQLITPDTGPALAIAAPPLDDTDPDTDERLEQGEDELSDAAVPEVPAAPNSTAVASTGRLGAVAASAPNGGDGAQLETPALASADSVRRLFSSLKIRPSESGGVVLEAPAETAAALGALFEGMARMLATAPPGRET